MFVKIRDNYWINLSQCASIEIGKNDSYKWKIVFVSLMPSSDIGKSDSIEGFQSENEAQEVLDQIWETYREGKPYFQPDPREKMNVRLGDKWYADSVPVDTYLEAIQLLGLQKIEALGETYEDKPIVTKHRIQGLVQSREGAYYILLLEQQTTMKKVLELIASKLGIIDFEVTLHGN